MCDMENKYRLREITPIGNICQLLACPAIYEVEELTPIDEKCTLVSCPSIHKIISKDEKCALALSCPAIYDEGIEKDYLIIGKKRNPEDFGLEKKVGKDEVLISVPKGIINNKQD